MSGKILELMIKDKIGTISINRPEALNALNIRFFQELDEMITRIETDNNIRVIIITGIGKAFVAGADISEMVKMNSKEASEFSQNAMQIFDRLESLAIPVIGAINGFALGGGNELSMACDIRIASSKAKFGQPEVSLGVTPGFAGTQRLPRLIGLGNALQLLFTGNLISAEEALRIGLVQQVVEPQSLMEEVEKLAVLIASKGPKAVKLVKQLARNGLNSSFKDGCKAESVKFGSLFGNEATEGMNAFLEKRPPKW
jgi:enoyl-CoA hydratase